MQLRRTIIQLEGLSTYINFLFITVCGLIYHRLYLVYKSRLLFVNVFMLFARCRSAP